MKQKCVARDLHTKIVNRLIEVHPRAIVLDYRYDNESCPSTAPESISLQSAILNATSQKIHVVIATPDWTQEELEASGRTSILPPGRELKPNEAILSTTRWQPLKANHYFHYALARIGCRVENLKLSWETFLNPDLSHSEVLPTLSRAVAAATDPGALENPYVQAADDNELDLLIPFLRADEIESSTATKFVCGYTAGPDEWKNCKSAPVDPDSADQ